MPVTEVKTLTAPTAFESAFESIRPYTDAEVPAVVRRLTANIELRDGIASFLFPRLYRISANATRQLTGMLLWWRARGLHKVYDVQMMVGRFIDHMVQHSVESLTYSGLDDLERNKAYLFISNHRDIALDSALLNRVLHAEGFATCEIAVGDNLFGTPFADDLMRLNRGFLVRRSSKGAKAAYAALMQTSAYVRHSLEEGNSVWIAQREGRAKDGFDRTEPALLKMLGLAYRKELSRLDELLDRIDIVPVGISYELDPCDLRKAHELWERATQGKFEKAADADLASIVEGVQGYKGRVHLNFAAPLSGQFATADAFAQALDRAIVQGLVVYPTNVDAQRHLGESGAQVLTHNLVRLPKVGQLFEQRISTTPEEQRPYLLKQYANLLRNRRELGIDPQVYKAQS